MLTQEKINAMKRLKDELKELKSNPIANIGVTVGLVNEDNIFEWQCTLKGPNDTSYRGGLFYLRVNFPDNYPNKPPEVTFRTPIYHLNINPRNSQTEKLGHVCINTLNWWKPEYKMKEVLTNIFALFYMANPQSPYGVDRAKEFNGNRALYEQKAQHFTQVYALPSSNFKYTGQDWDFSC